MSNEHFFFCVIFLSRVINNAGEAIGEVSSFRENIFTLFFDDERSTPTLAVKELPFEPCTVTRKGARKRAAAATASNATLNAPFVEQPCHGVKSSTRPSRIRWITSAIFTFFLLLFDYPLERSCTRAPSSGGVVREGFTSREKERDEQMQGSPPSMVLHFKVHQGDESKKCRASCTNLRSNASSWILSTDEEDLGEKYIEFIL